LKKIRKKNEKINFFFSSRLRPVTNRLETASRNGIESRRDVR